MLMLQLLDVPEYAPEGTSSVPLFAGQLSLSGAASHLPVC